MSVNPGYYQTDALQAWDIISMFDLRYDMGAVFKYLFRAGLKTKDPSLDIKKAVNYIDHHLNSFDNWDRVSWRSRSSASLLNSRIHMEDLSESVCEVIETIMTHDISREQKAALLAVLLFELSACIFLRMEDILISEENSNNTDFSFDVDDFGLFLGLREDAESEVEDVFVVLSSNLQALLETIGPGYFSESLTLFLEQLNRALFVNKNGLLKDLVDPNFIDSMSVDEYLLWSSQFEGYCDAHFRITLNQLEYSVRALAESV